jgi:hypothetical protein
LRAITASLDEFDTANPVRRVVGSAPDTNDLAYRGTAHQGSQKRCPIRSCGRTNVFPGETFTGHGSIFTQAYRRRAVNMALEAMSPQECHQDLGAARRKQQDRPDHTPLQGIDGRRRQPRRRDRPIGQVTPVMKTVLVQDLRQPSSNDLAGQM